MYTREDALKLIASKFPDETTVQDNWVNGEKQGKREVHWTPEKRLDQMINLHEPSYDGLKEGNIGIDVGLAVSFQDHVEHHYKNKHGLW